MTVNDFIAVFRSDMQDAVAPYLWSDDDIVRYLNDAVDEAAERARLIEDSTSAACCQITLVPDQATYPLHTSVFHVKRVTLAGKPLSESSVEVEDERNTTWESASSGDPSRFIVNGQATTITLVPAPAEAGTLKLTVYRTSLARLTTGTSQIELKQVYHARLKDWAYRCAYLKQDSETLNESKAGEHEAKFERAFGVRPSADTQRKRNDRRPPVVRMNPGW